MTDVRVPHLGESITSGVIARWHKQTGDVVRAEEPLFELETDKAAMEIAAEAAGTLEIVVPAGATVEVGAVVGRIAEDGAGAALVAESAPRVAAVETARGANEPHDRGTEPTEAQPSAPPRPARPLADSGPAVRKLVAERDVDPSMIPATGRDGRLTKHDVVTATARPPERTDGDGTRRVPMSQLRRVIAARLVEAQRTAAILTTFNEIEMMELLALRRRHRERFKQRHGVDLGLMSLFGRATILALQAQPIVNARIEDTDIVYSDAVHLGIAVSTPRGLVVPVVRNAQAMSIAELERAIADLAASARDGRISPDDLSGGTFTITNGGVFGSLLSTPILNPPQAGILGMHKIEDRVVARDGQPVVRPMMYVALSYDHRLVDGEQAVTFLVRVKEQLEDPGRMVLDV
jgi:2-oxoglutarate dehydrogenase E2 component (dihydrolipoamide succinyltransferase)